MIACLAKSMVTQLALRTASVEIELHDDRMPEVNRDSNDSLL